MISKSIQKALNYNEQKCIQGRATCIYAANFLKDKDQMNFYDKLNRFSRLINLNDRATTNSLHISLNFDSTENVSQQELSRIAQAYMQKIGFGEQPFLVYQHLDAGHPHLHVVTTNIRKDGSRINTHNIGRNQSEKARKEVEQEFNLVRASSKSYTQAYGIKGIDPAKIIYGKSETKRSITNILNVVVPQYKYTSLAELNAILQQYNVLADRGREDGSMYRNEGLVYRVLDQCGQKIGVPIKASSIYNSPTLKTLQTRFVDNLEARKMFRDSVRNRIDEVLTNTKDWQQFMRELRKKGLATVLRRNDKGFIYGVTYVDHQTKSVFNGSDLGKPYSAAAIGQRIGQMETEKEKTASSFSQPSTPAVVTTKDQMEVTEQKETTLDYSSNQEGLLELLTKPERGPQNIPYDLRKKKKKKRKRNLGL